MPILRWLGRSGLRLTLLVALAFFAFHVVSEIRLLGGEDPSFLQRLDLTALDLEFRHRGPRPPEDWKVVVVAADERSIRKLGRLPWSRTVHATLSEKLAELGVAATAFDITFEPDTESDEVRSARLVERAERTQPVTDAVAAMGAAVPVIEQAARAARASADLRVAKGATALAGTATRLGEARADLDAYLTSRSATSAAMRQDARFAEALGKAGNVVIGVFAHSRVEAEAAGPESLARSLALLRTATISELITEGDLIREDSRQAIDTGIYRRFYGVEAPSAPLAEAARGFGTINAFPDADGVYRRVPLISAIKGHGALIPTLALSAVSVALGEPIDVIASADDPSPHAVRVGPLYTELELAGTVTLDWYGGFEPDQMPIVSVADVLDGTADVELLAGRIAFVAATAVGTYDQRVTAFGTSVPGVVVHATLAQNLIDGRHRIRPRFVIGIELLVFVLIGLVSGLVLTRLGALGQIGASILLAVGWVLIDRFVFFELGWVVTVLLPVIQVFVTLVVIASWSYLVEEREKRRTKAAFRQYLSPQVMEQVLQNPEEYLKLGGRRTEATVLFSDIRGFTTFSEGLTPEALGDLLNRYMTPMTDLVFAHGGTLDKYIGDAVMAFWGAPIVQADHAVRGCKAALRMIEKVQVLNVELEQAKLPRIAIGIGLSSGPMTVGNMGSADHFSYTALGDRVNLGSRLEGQTKEYGVDIIVSEATYVLIKDVMFCRELGHLRVKGKVEPVRIYELISDRPLSIERRAFVDAFHEGLERFRGRDFAAAIACFERAREKAGERGDRTTEDYLAQCAIFLREPPPPDWDGVRTATAK